MACGVEDKDEDSRVFCSEFGVTDLKRSKEVSEKMRRMMRLVRILVSHVREVDAFSGTMGSETMPGKAFATWM